MTNARAARATDEARQPARSTRWRSISRAMPAWSRAARRRSPARRASRRRSSRQRTRLGGCRTRSSDDGPARDAARDEARAGGGRAVRAPALAAARAGRADRRRRRCATKIIAISRGAPRRTRRELRGGIAKLGQLASCRPDLVGPIWASELATLQDDVPPVDAAAIRARIEAELGAADRRAVRRRSTTRRSRPRSLAQVHAATLLDGTRGRRQGAGARHRGRDRRRHRGAAHGRAARSARCPGVDLATLVDELGARARRRARLRRRGRRAARVRGRGVRAAADRRRASTARVLTMTRIDGERLTTWLERATAAPDARSLLGELVGEVAAQILVRGQVHADPHPGNFLVTPDGKLALLDFGCMLDAVARTSAPPTRGSCSRSPAATTQAAAAELATLGFTRRRSRRSSSMLTAALIGAMQPGANAVRARLAGGVRRLRSRRPSSSAASRSRARSCCSAACSRRSRACSRPTSRSSSSIR